MLHLYVHYQNGMVLSVFLSNWFWSGLFISQGCVALKYLIVRSCGPDCQSNCNLLEQRQLQHLLGSIAGEVRPS